MSGPEVPEIRIEATRTKGDYFWAIAFNMVRNARVWAIYLVSSLLIAGATYAVDEPRSIATFATTLTLMLLLYLLVAAVSVYWSAQRNWNAPGGLSRYVFTLSGEGLKAQHEFGEGQSSWAVWKDFFETRRLFVIRHTLGVIQIIPKRDLGEETASQLRALLRRQLQMEKAR